MLDAHLTSGQTAASRRTIAAQDRRSTLSPSARRTEGRRRRATVESIGHILRPQSVALIGASRNPQKVGSRILEGLRTGGFFGALYVVHPEASVIQGVRTVLSVEALPRGVDLAIVCVPADGVISVVNECARAGVRAVVVISAGFAEMDEDGRLLQDALVGLVRASGMRMVGPNSLGLVNLDHAAPLHAACSPILPAAGGISLASQSSALGIAVLDLASQRELALSSLVSVGNQADISSNDLLEYWASDPATRVILLYLESFGDPLRFASIARRVAGQKPIIALKAGRTESGSRARGRAAALADNQAVVNAIFQQTGVISADRIDEMFDIAACLDQQPLPQGRRVAIVTNAGGSGILATDACAISGLTVASLVDDTRLRLEEILPAAATREYRGAEFSVDGPSAYRDSVEALLDDPGVDSVIVIYAPVAAGRSADIFASIGQAVAAARARGIGQKPVLICATTRIRRAASLEAGSERLPAYMFPEDAVRALGKITRYAEWRATQRFTSSQDVFDGE
jgi:acyl-CoA synthetase (NDP forming)